MKYYINVMAKLNPNNNNEVHKVNCSCFPKQSNFLGEFKNGVEAVNYAKAVGYIKADGCAICCPEAHNE